MTRRSSLFAASISFALAVAMVIVISRASSAPRTTSLGSLGPVPLTKVSATAANATPVTVPPIPVTATTAPDPTLPDTVVPVRLTIGPIGVVAPVVATGVDAATTNQIEVADLDHVGWYRFGPRPGEYGSAVLVGHVDGAGRTGIFWRLRQLVPGDRVTVAFSDGATRAFVVTGRQEIPKQGLPADLFSRQGPPRLTMITCGGAFNQATGHYIDNVIVVATPAS